METVHKLFGSLPVFVYHCFDRIVIQGYLPLLTREEHIVHFFRTSTGSIRSRNRPCGSGRKSTSGGSMRSRTTIGFRSNAPMTRR
jgi:hypothetical protein